MRIYRCIFTNDEVLCDNDKKLEVQDGVVYVIHGKYVDVGGEDYGISANVEEDAAEGAKDEAGASAKARVVDIVHQNRLVETAFDKASFGAYIKGYFKKLKEKLDEADPEVGKQFQAGAQVFMKKVLKDFGDYQFFLPESMSDEGIIVLCRWDGEDAIFYYWRHGLKDEKV